MNLSEEATTYEREQVVVFIGIDCVVHVYEGLLWLLLKPVNNPERLIPIGTKVPVINKMLAFDHKHDAGANGNDAEQRGYELARPYWSHALEERVIAT